MTAFVKHLGRDSDRLAELRHELEAWLEAERVPADAIFEIKLVAHEAASSAVAHAAAGSDVVVRAEIAGGEVVVEVIDPSDPPWALAVPPTEDELTGLQLINGLPRRVKAIPLPRGAALVMQLGRG